MNMMREYAEAMARVRDAAGMTREDFDALVHNAKRVGLAAGSEDRRSDTTDLVSVHKPKDGKS